MSEKSTQHSSTEDIFREVVAGTAATTGSEFFYSLVQHLAQALDLRYCFLTECLDSPPSKLSTLAFWNGSGFQDNFEYDLAGTPCAQVVAGKACFYDQDIQSLFPDDQDLVDLEAQSYAAVPFQDSDGRVIGHLAVIDVERLDEDSFDFSVLELFAARAGAELERQRVVFRLEASERTLLESEARLREVIDLVPHFIFAKDREGRFNLINRATAEAYNTTVEGLLGRTDAEFASSAEEVRRFRSDDLEVINSGRAKVIPEEQITNSEGEVRYLQTTKIPFTRADSELPSVLGVSVDITDLKRAAEERRKLDTKMRQAQKLESLGVLAGGIAHDFNNLLVGMLGNATLALARLPENAPARLYIGGIKTAAQRAADLSNQMLAYSGRGKFIVEPIDLGALVNEMLNLLRASVTKKAKLSLDLRSGLPAIEADITEVRQVVMNLLTNAAEALGDDEGVISVSTRALDVDRSYLAKTYLEEGLPEGHYVLLEVSDTGCGMDEETREKIFDPFFTTKFSGRGLGLAAVLGIVRGHGGALEVTSEEGRGSSFRVLFPATTNTIESQPTVLPSEEIGGNGRTILVVDDDPVVVEVAQHILVDSGFCVLTAVDGLTALDRLELHSHEISAVLLDMTMPHLDGIQTLAAIRKRYALPVVLTSGYSEQEVHRRLGGAMPNGFIQKPFAPKGLLDELAKALANGQETAPAS